MMLCKADFEDLFPDLFVPEETQRSNWHAVSHGLLDSPGSEARSASQKRSIADNVTNLEPTSMQKIQLESRGLTTPTTPCRMIR